MEPDNNFVLSKAVRIFIERGFDVLKIGERLYQACLRRLRINLWFPGDEFPIWPNPLDMISNLRLDDTHALFVVSERPYALSDYVLNNIAKARYWYGKNIEVRVFSINTLRLEEDIEEGINMAITYYYKEVMNGMERGDKCPRCSSDMNIAFKSRFYSYRWRRIVIQEVEFCPNCNIVIHRIILSTRNV